MPSTVICASRIARRPKGLATSCLSRIGTCCEVVGEVPSTQGWIEAMTSLGRLIFFDQPGTGASDPVTPGGADVGAMGRQHHRGTRRHRE